MDTQSTREKKDECFLPIEEHAARLYIAAPIFAAVMQAQNWAAGKKVEKIEFEKAVKAFLSNPIGG